MVQQHDDASEVGIAQITFNVMQALPDEGCNALLSCLLPDLKEMGHAHAHQPDLNRQLCLQQPKGNCLNLRGCADVLRQAVSSRSEFKSCGFQLEGEGFAFQVLSCHITSQMLSNLSTLQMATSTRSIFYH